MRSIIAETNRSRAVTNARRITVVTAFAALFLVSSTFAQSRKGELVFNTFREAGSTSGTGDGFTFTGWYLRPPSDPSQGSVSFSFGVPGDMDGSQPLIVDVHFMTYVQSATGNVVMRCESSFGDTFPSQTGTRTSTVAVVAPPNQRLNHYVATFSISGEATPKVFGIL